MKIEDILKIRDLRIEKYISNLERKSDVIEKEYNKQKVLLKRETDFEKSKKIEKKVESLEYKMIKIESLIDNKQFPFKQKVKRDDEYTDIQEAIAIIQHLNKYNKDVKSYKKLGDSLFVYFYDEKQQPKKGEFDLYRKTHIITKDEKKIR